METKEEARTTPTPPLPQQFNFSSSSTSSRKSRRSVQKSVVSVPVFKVDAARPKNGIDAVMPSDSWTWRKYGQKPIKGSPYPRGYYRCSSSKGCPARKQVERSCVNPTMFTVTYSVNHNHSLPLPKLHHHHNSPPAAIAPAEPDSKLPEADEPPPHDLSPTVDPEKKFCDLMIEEPALMITDEFGWFVDISSPSSLSPQAASDADLLYGHTLNSAATMLLPEVDDKFSSRGSRMTVDDEEDGLFGGLGELPEWSLVFGHGFLDHQLMCGGEEGKRCGPC